MTQGSGVSWSEVNADCIAPELTVTAIYPAWTTSFGIFFMVSNIEQLLWHLQALFCKENVQQRRRVVLFDEVERLSQVNCYDVGLHAALKYTDMKDLVLKKNPSSPI